MLTKAQVLEIQKAIKRRILAFTYEALGERALTKAEIKILQRAGLLRTSVKNLVGDPYLLGKVAALVERERIRDLSYEKVMSVAHKLKKKTPVEKQMIDYAKDHAGQYIKNIGDSLAKEVGVTAARRAQQSLRVVRKEVVEAIKDRKTASELKTALYEAVDDKNRDWQRVAVTEMNDAVQNGIYNEIRAQSDEGDKQLVYKRPAPDACKYCKMVYLESDGVTPKIFRLKDLQASNIGKKASSWGPTVGSVHPWCQCQIHPVIQGYSFVKKRVATEEFTSQGKQYKRGQIIEDGDFDNLPASKKAKTRLDATLTRTGKQPLISKSLNSLSLSENEDCICEY